MSDMNTGFTFDPPGDNEGDSGDGTEEFINGFLKNVPEADRPVVDRYLKQIQGGVTQGYQKIHEQYRPYKELGHDPETLARAAGVWELLNDDPKRVYSLLKEMAQEQGWETDPNAPPPEIPAALKGLPPELAAEIKQMKDALMGIGQEILTSREQKVQEEQDRQLDSYMNWLKETSGDFDEQWVLTRMQAGVDGVQAVKDYQKFVDQIIQQNGGTPGRRPTPRVLGGAGSVQVDRGPDLKNASNQEVRDHIVAMLAHNANQ